ncbi:hypothetical protein V6N13_093332 [Hibiscus sabdariffa]
MAVESLWRDTSHSIDGYRVRGAGKGVAHYYMGEKKIVVVKGCRLIPELRRDRTSAKALDRSVDAGRLGSAVRSAASVLRVIERQGNNPRTGLYIEKKPSNEGH